MVGIILRVDSRGGSAIASDLIAREVMIAKQKGKKVIALMSNVAGIFTVFKIDSYLKHLLKASGGYYISCHADLIMCQPLTITGSIGVTLFLKLVLNH